MRNCFRVSSRGRSKLHPYSLQANDSFSKQQWITCLRQAIVHSRDKMAQASQSQLSLHPDPVVYHIAELSLSSNTEMAAHTSCWLFRLIAWPADVWYLPVKFYCAWTLKTSWKRLKWKIFSSCFSFTDGLCNFGNVQHKSFYETVLLNVNLECKMFCVWFFFQ